MTKYSCMVGNECQALNFIRLNNTYITQNLANGFGVAQTPRNFLKIPYHGFKT